MKTCHHTKRNEQHVFRSVDQEVNDRLGFDDDKVSILTLLDLSASSDIKDHSILLTRLQHSFDICDLSLAWFHSYPLLDSYVLLQTLYLEFLPSKHRQMDKDLFHIKRLLSETISLKL